MTVPSDIVKEWLTKIDLKNSTTIQLPASMEKFINWDEFGSPYIKERFAAETLKDGSSF